MPNAKVACVLAFIMAVGCHEKSKDRKPDAGQENDIPVLEVKEGNTLHLSEGIARSNSSCKDADGKEHPVYAKSDIIFGIHDGKIFTEANEGCPIVIKTTSRILSASSISKINSTLANLQITVTRNKDCKNDDVYAGLSLMQKARIEGDKYYGGLYFVHVIPRSRAVCDNEFQMHTDWDQLKNVFAEAFDQATPLAN